MNTNGFAVFLAPSESRRAAIAAEKGEWRRGRLVKSELGDDAEMVAFALDGGVEALPLVHGFGMGEGGEYSFFKRAAEGFSCGRDGLGTRGLYTDRGWTCIATDHRFVGPDARLLPSGARAEVGTRKVATEHLVPDAFGGTLDEAAARLAELLMDSVKRRVAGKKTVAVSFSGGLDSSLIALLASRETGVLLCSTFADGSRDQEQTEYAAGVLGLRLATRSVGRREVSEEMRAANLPFRPSEMDLALWSLYSSTSRTAAEEGAELILLGQLADELFGGYMKYALAARRAPREAEDMMRADVAACGNVAFIRDEMACARFSEARFPFADEKIASFALGLPISYKISGGERKVVLRRAARLLGLPEPLVTAPKKAAQYSSGVGRLVL